MLTALVFLTWLTITVLGNVQGPITKSNYAVIYYTICFLLGFCFPFIEFTDDEKK